MIKIEIIYCSTSTTFVSLIIHLLTTFYVRISCSDALGIVRDVGEAAESSGVGINAILQNSITDSKDVSFAVATEKAMLSQVTAFAEKIAAKKWCNAAPFFMPIM